MTESKDPLRELEQILNEALRVLKEAKAQNEQARQ